MRAAVVHDFALPLRLEDVRKPESGDGDVEIEARLVYDFGAAGPSRKPEGVLTGEAKEHQGPVPG